MSPCLTAVFKFNDRKKPLTASRSSDRPPVRVRLCAVRGRRSAQCSVLLFSAAASGQCHGKCPYFYRLVKERSNPHVAGETMPILTGSTHSVLFNGLLWNINGLGCRSGDAICRNVPSDPS